MKCLELAYLVSNDDKVVYTIRPMTAIMV